MALFDRIFGSASLRALHDLDDARLRDLGLNRYDLFEARTTRGSITAFLDARRASAFFAKR